MEPTAAPTHIDYAVVGFERCLPRRRFASQQHLSAVPQTAPVARGNVVQRFLGNEFVHHFGEVAWAFVQRNSDAAGSAESVCQLE